MPPTTSDRPRATARSVTLIVCLLGLVVASALVAPGPGPAAGAPTARPRPWRTGIAVDTTTVHRSSGVAVSGRVRPAVRGTTVVVQKRLKGSRTWSDDVRLRTRADGRWSYRDLPTRPGKRFYRAVVPATDRHPRGRSRELAVTVFRNRWLHNLPARARGTVENGVVSVAGRTWRHSAVAGDAATNGFVEWRLGRRCRLLTYALGNGDGAAPGTTARLALLADGKVLDEQVHAAATKGSATYVSLRGVDRLRFRWSSTDEDGSPAPAEAALVEAGVVCST